jgi:dihydroorotate dehydrogenase electron transfer subunit
LSDMLQVKAEVRSNTELLNHGLPTEAWLMWLDAPSVARVAKPGQFVMVRCGESHDPLLRRPLGIHLVSNTGGVALLFGKAGRGTAWLSQRVPGDLIDLIGPLGNGFVMRRGTRSLLLLAGGIGFAPLAFMAETANREGKATRLVMGARARRWLYPTTCLPSGVDVVRATEDGSEGRIGLVTQIVGEFADEADQVFACGPPAMYKAMAGLDCLKGKSVQVSLEERMACGLGACYGCTVKTSNGLKQVCQDGPVFELADIVWQGSARWSRAERFE